MVKFNDLEVLLKEQQLTDEDIQLFKKEIGPIYDFYDFMLIKHNMDYDDVDKDSQEFSSIAILDYKDKLNKDEDSIMKNLIESISDIMKRYANKYDYDKSDELKLSMTKIMELQLINLMVNKNDNTEKPGN
jgi:hypothetical protein